MALEVGAVVEGKVTGITKFGAFVALPEGKSGLVHISEVANAFVSDVHDHVQMGQTVKVRILSISPEGKINLSIKKAEDRPAQPREQSFRRAPQQQRQQQEQPQRPAPVRTAADPPSEDQAFEDRLKKFMQESDSRIADNRMYSERKQRSRRR